MSMYVFMVITETGIVLEAPSMNHNISHRNITASDKAVIIIMNLFLSVLRKSRWLAIYYWYL